MPFLQFPPAARRVLYTTNSIESLNAQLRKATRNRGQFPNDTAALKTLWLMICNIEDKRAAQRAKKAKRNIECNGYIEGAKATGWKQAINQLAVAFPRPIRGLLVNQAPRTQTNRHSHSGRRLKPNSTTGSAGQPMTLHVRVSRAGLKSSTTVDADTPHSGWSALSTLRTTVV